ncbi:MAG: helix-turn-helix transcriptional regulator [Rhodospirillales bacterium]|nr:helix-turn-helix transcriptional regulator [Rhodospirillales bacterium]
MNTNKEKNTCVSHSPAIGAECLDTLKTELGQNIRKLRRIKGLSQKQVGDTLGITYQQVQKYEKGQNRIPADFLILLQNLFNVPYSELLPSGKKASPAPIRKKRRRCNRIF